MGSRGARRAEAVDPEEGDGEAAPRALWKGTVTFGLVEIPVALVSASARRQEIRFTLLDRRDFQPVGYERVNKRSGKPVPWDEIVKGFEHEPDNYVVLTEEELAAANAEATRTIDIQAFVEASQIDSVYWDTPYYLEPLKREKSKAYALLREALRASGRVGIARVVIRSRQRVAALAVRDDAIVLNVLRYAYELRSPDDVRVPRGALKALGIETRELDLARQLIDGMAAPWKPEAFKDEYREDVLALVERKVKAGKTKEVVTVSAARGGRPRGEVIDLMPLLERSMAARKGASARKAVSASPPRTPRKTARRRRA